MEYIIYSDESVSKGEIFSDFFGGALVTNRNHCIYTFAAQILHPNE